MILAKLLYENISASKKKSVPPKMGDDEIADQLLLEEFENSLEAENSSILAKIKGSIETLGEQIDEKKKAHLGIIEKVKLAKEANNFISRLNASD